MADLKSQGQNVAETKLYADIDFRFKPHPVTGDVTIKYDTDEKASDVQLEISF